MLSGELFKQGGHFACAIPAAGIPGAIPFKVTAEHEAGCVPGSPSWTDVTVGSGRKKVYVRINPEIMGDWFRLADCLHVAHSRAEKIPQPPGWYIGQLPPEVGKKYCFQRLNSSGPDVILIDTLERLSRHATTTPPPLHDGQNRL